MDVEDFVKVISKYLERFQAVNVVSVERLLSPCDKISLVYLLSDNPEIALQQLRTNLKCNIITKWCEYHEELNQREWKLRLIESLILMQNYKVLKALGYNKRDLGQVKDLLGQAMRSEEFDIRKILYSTFDKLSIHELHKVVDTIDGNRMREPVELYSPKHIEVYLLQWQIDSLISLNSNGLDCIKRALKSVNLEYYLTDIYNFIASNDIKDHTGNYIPEAQLNELTSPVLANDECIATLNLDEPSNDYYPIIDPEQVGICIIVNQENYPTSTKHKPRFGSQYDCVTLQRTMNVLKIKTITLNDLPHNNIFPSIEREVNENFIANVHSVLFVVIMAHGEKGSIFGIDGKSVDTDTIRDSLSNAKCPCLKNKPKVIIFQSCRGEYYYDASGLLQADGSEGTAQFEQIKSSMEDYIICWSTIPGFKSYRHIFNGSMYIQTFCKYLIKHKEEHIEAILKLVLKDFSTNKEQKLNCYDHIIGMVPEYSCGLIQDLYLFKK